MTASNNNLNDNKDNNEDAISPDTMALIARAKKSFLFSLSLLLLGIVAVILAIVFRSDKEPVKTQTYTAGVLVAPAGAKILSSVPSEGMFAITYVLEGKTKLRLIDGATGAVIRDIDFASE